MNRNRIVTGMCLALLALPAAGCNADSAQRIAYARQGVTWLRQTSSSLDGQIAAVQTALAESERQLADPNLAGDTVEKLRAAVAKFSEELRRLQAQKVQVDATLGKLQEIVDRGAAGDGDFSDELRMIGESLLAGSELAEGQLAVWLKIAGGALITLAGLFGGWKQKQLGTTRTALAQVVEGGEKFKVDEGGVAGWKEQQTTVQSPKTAALVAQIRAELATKGGDHGQA